MAKDFFKQFVADIDDPDTSLASDGTSSSEFTSYMDTGSYSFNAALSADLYGGFPDNKVLLLAGDPSTGKTFFALSLIKNFLDQKKDGKVFYFDTESAITNKMLEDRGIDTNRVVKSEPDTIEKFRMVAVKILDKYADIPKEERFPLLMVLDSLSALPSNKEVADTVAGNDTRDMTKPGVIKGTFRVLRLKMAKVGVPFIVTNHVYTSVGQYIPMKVIGGGMGGKYAADTIAMLSKKSEKDDDKNVTGSLVRVKMEKSRMTREGITVDVRIQYSGGLDPYYGLLDMAEAAGVVKKNGNKIEFPNGTKAFEKAILKNPSTYFTDDVLEQINAYVKEAFAYSGGIEHGNDSIEDGEESQEQ